MLRPLVIFGTGDFAELARIYFDRFSDFSVIAFSVDSEFMASDTLHGLPVVEFESLASTYPPEEFSLFLAIGYTRLNSVRQNKFYFAKKLGYELPSFVSPHATLTDPVAIGENCFIFEDNTIQPFVTIGDNVVLWSGNHVGHHSVVGDHSFITSQVTISGRCRIGESCFVGVNASIGDHVTIGDRCVIGAGALLTQNVDSDGVFAVRQTGRLPLPSSRLPDF